MNGVGEQHGPLRPDYGPDWAELICDKCDATWVAIIGSNCLWCQRALENMCRWQAELTLRLPDIDPDDQRYDNAMTAWAQRLARAVNAQLITEAKARLALARAKSRRT
jgi:hypothetical protein